MSPPKGDDQLRRSIEELRSEVGLIRRRAVGELARLKDPRALDALMATATRDPEAQVRQDAARAVEVIRGKVSIPVDEPSEPGETTEHWSGRVLKGASSQTGEGFQRSGFERTKKLKKSDLERTVGLGPPPVRSSAAENARALEAVRNRPAQDALTLRKQLLDEALQSMGIKVEQKRYGFKLAVPLLNGRKQFVRVGYEQSDFESDKVIVVFSPCGRADPKHFRWALELNHGLSYGKLGLVSGPQGDEFVMSATLLEATADPAEVRKAILSVAEKADKVEAQFSPEDRL
jgi:hypothetical protein